MRLNELKSRLEKIRDRGYLQSGRTGSTGIGYTFETEMGLAESNIAIPDIGGTVEIKTTRKTSTSLITLFTFNKGAWRTSQGDVIRLIGYTDKKGRKALKSTLFYGRENAQGIALDIDDTKNVVTLEHPSLGIFAEWDLYVIVGTFYTKLSRLLMVLADSRRVSGQEEFHFNEAYLLSEPNVRAFREAFKNSLLGIDLRMHLNPAGGVRNRGTGFRIREKDLITLYDKKVKLVLPEQKSVPKHFS